MIVVCENVCYSLWICGGDVVVYECDGFGLWSLSMLECSKKCPNFAERSESVKLGAKFIPGRFFGISNGSFAGCSELFVYCECFWCAVSFVSVSCVVPRADRPVAFVAPPGCRARFVLMAWSCLWYVLVCCGDEGVCKLFRCEVWVVCCLCCHRF